MTRNELEVWLRQHPADRRTLVQGILNITPDSFSDGGKFLDPQAALDRAWEMLAEGADWIDVGGESTRPGSPAVPAAEQLRRVLPVVESVAGTGAVVSIDTTLAEVARACLDGGAAVVNDVSGAADDPEMPTVMAGAPAVVLMHRPAPAETMQAHATYADVVAEVEAFLHRRADLVADAGSERHRILLDPGIGFGKTLRHNLLLLRAIDRFTAGSLGVLVGTSRKRFIGTVTGETTASDRLFGTAATVAWCAAHGVNVVRVHDVKSMRQVVQMTTAIADPEAVADDALK